MTKNDFPSPLHKEKQVQGHSCCRRLMLLPDVGAAERLTSLQCSSPSWRRTKQPSEKLRTKGRGDMGGGVYSSLHAEVLITWWANTDRTDWIKVCRASNDGTLLPGGDTIKALSERTISNNNNNNNEWPHVDGSSPELPNVFKINFHGRLSWFYSWMKKMPSHYENTCQMKLYAFYPLPCMLKFGSMLIYNFYLLTFIEPVSEITDFLCKGRLGLKEV